MFWFLQYMLIHTNFHPWCIALTLHGWCGLVYLKIFTSSNEAFAGTYYRSLIFNTNQLATNFKFLKKYLKFRTPLITAVHETSAKYYQL